MHGRSTIARIAYTIGILLAATGGASSDWLRSDDSVRALIAGKRVYLSIPLGGEFPLHYQASGRVIGDGSAVGLSRFFAPRETGEWWVSDGQLCQRFPTWYEGRVHCFQLRPTSETKLRWRRDDGYSGRARIQQ
jgi:hypothetical protein